MLWHGVRVELWNFSLYVAHGHGSGKRESCRLCCVILGKIADMRHRNPVFERITNASGLRMTIPGICGREAVHFDVWYCANRSRRCSMGCVEESCTHGKRPRNDS